MINRLQNYKKILVLFLDIILVSGSFYLSFLIRFDGNIPFSYLSVMVRWLPILVATRIGAFLFFGLYQGIWRYASINELLRIAQAVVLSSVVFILIVVFGRGLVLFPRSAFIIDMLLVSFLISVSRFFLRIYREVMPEKNAGKTKRLLIVGAGDAGNLVLREIKHNPELCYDVVGFIDDRESKRGMSIQGVSVRGTRRDIARVVNERHVDEIIIAIPSAGLREIRAIVNECEKTNVRIKIVPALNDLINGTVSLNQIREVMIEDLLGRDVVEIDTENIRKYIKGKRVLVTGAGGSIGSEICRQIMKYDPRALVLLGRGEFSIYSIHNELAALDPETQLVQVVGDIINKRKLEGVFRKYLPEIVFHAAADKHVPLLEMNPDEAILNNIIGTRNVIEVAEAHGTEKVVCVSTDKAADPVSVMGCSKKIAETIIKGRSSSRTQTMGVRFGNVLGSRGSVIPLFKKQIAGGGPVTVTHPEMVRYFMTIPEAAQLVLQAGAMGTCGDIFLLDMGEPVHISDLACRMIKLSGLEPDKDIRVVYSGLRPGEKLVEALTGASEKLFRTSHPKIFNLKVEGPVPDITEKDIEELRASAIEMDEDAIRSKLQQLIPAYRPAPRG